MPASISFKLIAHLLTLRSRLQKKLNEKRLLLRQARQPLLQSWRLVLWMAKLSPYSTALILLGRLYGRLMPSFDLRLKGEFLDLVSLSWVYIC